MSGVVVLAIRRTIVDLVCSLDRFGILMIPSSTIAFQIVSGVIAFLSIVTFGMTSYLLGFHVYLCKCTHLIAHSIIVSLDRLFRQKYVRLRSQSSPRSNSGSNSVPIQPDDSAAEYRIDEPVENSFTEGLSIVDRSMSMDVRRVCSRGKPIE